MNTVSKQRVGEKIWTIIVAAGSGARFGSPKQFALINERRIVDWAVETAKISSDGVVVVLPAEQAQREGGVAGGSTRSASVRCGLAAVPRDATIICVHDAARPFASEFLFDEVIDAVCKGADGAVPGLPVVDTIKFVDASNVVTSTPDRSQLVAVQTPQAFRAMALRSAHENNPESTDDSTLVESRGGRVVVVIGDPLNRKITTPEDLNWARAISRGEV
ncbi:MAG: 2-C-methyl-D-erythritol 4-phosphate cytidylyltransferase [Actinomycetota bacterium]|nr:2-C-methyl-D-erythritol 4-phosphate cytidylyltransferase [Actinomycetota bacterium]MDA3003594.1 2-C-methyl-D-erythritol 4-phosphate cytidylyltransferase [Actinomycetota bacterium]